MKDLQKDLTIKKYTDTELVLTDLDDVICLAVHRSVLVCASDYFSKLFDEQKILSTKSQSVRIEVCNAKIARDVILSLYELKAESFGFHDGNTFWIHLNVGSNFVLIMTQLCCMI